MRCNVKFKKATYLKIGILIMLLCALAPLLAFPKFSNCFINSIQHKSTDELERYIDQNSNVKLIYSTDAVLFDNDRYSDQDTPFPIFRYELTYDQPKLTSVDLVSLLKVRLMYTVKISSDDFKGTELYYMIILKYNPFDWNISYFQVDI